uniref:Uncharacterized protein n=1 Tax=Candidatus Kentrum sp. TC TaxID=2126339 RepID=A0A450ZHA4_9GAMM|nr:MAG: hypothetical protein BECKTC1821F_GA0114240_100238 [Candidatus Kentron sp. TC]
MNPQLAYMEKLTALIRQSPPSSLEEVLRARLTGDRSEVRGIVSPPLTQDEPDANLLIYYVYDALKDEPASREYLRRALANLTTRALTKPKPDLEYVGALGRLIGYTHVRDSAPLAESLRFQFLGLLAFGLPAPLEDIMALGETDLAKAHHLLDIFLAVTPPLWREDNKDEPARARLVATFQRAASDIRDTPDYERFRLFLLLFRAMLKLAPEFAGAEAFPEMCRVVETISKRATGKLSDHIQHDWLGTCWELGLLLNDEEHAHWKARFMKGLRRQSIGEDLTRPDFEEIFRDSLEEMGFDEEARRILSQALGRAGFANLTETKSAIPAEASAERPRPQHNASKEIYVHHLAKFREEQETMATSVQAPKAPWSADNPDYSNYRDRIGQLSRSCSLSATVHH